MKILLADWGTPFGLNTPNTSPLGGSEYSILLLAKGLTALGHSVILLNSSQTSPEQDDKLIIGSITNFNDVADQSDIILLNRSIPQNIIPFIDKKPIYIWSHDAYDQDITKQYMHSNLFKIVKNLFCVSEWQKQTYCKYLKLSSDKIKVLPNPIDLNLYSGYTKRNLNQLIFSSIPYKGLSEIPRIFNDIIIKTKRDDLTFKIFSSMQLYNNSEADNQYQEIYDKLNSMNGIHLNQPVSAKQLAYELSTSNFYIHPATYHETFGRVFVESMAGGCLPITFNNGANLEVIKTFGFVLPERSILNISSYEKYIDLLSNLLNETSKTDKYYKNRLLAFEYVKQFDYLKIANLFLSYIK